MTSAELGAVPQGASGQVALTVCMKNEGMFALEWIAYHHNLGFSPIIVVSNDCTDGSHDLLQRLHEMGVIVHIPQVLAAGANPQDAGMVLVMEHCRANGIAHLMHIDVDEFVVLDGDLSQLMARTQGADVVPFCWRSFGDSGIKRWQPGDLVIRANTRAEVAPDPKVAKYKCLFKVASFTSATDHHPVGPLIPDPVVMTPDAEMLRNASLFRKSSARFLPLQIAARAVTARLFHYAIRSEDVFLMKNDRGDGQGKIGGQKYFVNSRWHRIANRNDVFETAMEDLVPGVERRLESYRKDAQVMALEAACQEWFVARRDKVLSPSQIAEWTR